MPSGWPAISHVHTAISMDLQNQSLSPHENWDPDNRNAYVTDNLSDSIFYLKVIQTEA